MLIQEKDKVEKLVYFVRNMLKGTESNNQNIERLSFSGSDKYKETQIQLPRTLSIGVNQLAHLTSLEKIRSRKKVGILGS